MHDSSHPFMVLHSQPIRLPAQPVEVRRWKMTNNHPVIIDVSQRGDPAHESSIVKARTGAGQATYQAVASSECRSLVTWPHLIRIDGNCSVRANMKVAKTEPPTKNSSFAVGGATGVRTTAWEERVGRVNWGPSGVCGLDSQPDGIRHKPLGGRQRRRCGRSKQRSSRTIQPAGEPRTTGPAGGISSLRCRLDASPVTELPSKLRMPAVTAYKPAKDVERRWPWRQAGLKPYWGKPAVRNFRGGGGNDLVAPPLHSMVKPKKELPTIRCTRPSGRPFLFPSSRLACAPQSGELKRSADIP